MFARSDHPVKFSNELVDKLQKNTFVRYTRSSRHGQKVGADSNSRPIRRDHDNKNSSTRNA
jgi:galactokinase/mevalonate kinase-like predicted kinase